MNSVHPRQWLRFRLMLVILLVTQACVAMAWVRIQLKWIADRHAITLGDGKGGPMALVEYGDEAPFALRIFGERGVRSVHYSSTSTNDEKCRLIELFPEAKVTF